jgi:hypothetical protein
MGWDELQPAGNRKILLAPARRPAEIPECPGHEGYGKAERNENQHV